MDESRKQNEAVARRAHQQLANSSSVERSEPDSGLQFIHVSHPSEFKSKATRDVVRRHVAGNIGNRRRRPSLSFVLAVNPLSGNAGGSNSLSAGSESEDNRPTWDPQISIPRPLDSNGVFPVDTDPRARQLIHFSRAGM